MSTLPVGWSYHQLHISVNCFSAEENNLLLENGRKVMKHFLAFLSSASLLLVTPIRPKLGIVTRWYFSYDMRHLVDLHVDELKLFIPKMCHKRDNDAFFTRLSQFDSKIRRPQLDVFTILKFQTIFDEFINAYATCATRLDLGSSIVLHLLFEK